MLVGAIIAFLYIPIAFLILFSFEQADTPGFPITGLTLHWYEKMLTDSAIQSALFNSVLVAVIVVPVVVLTSSHEEKDMVASYKLGVNSYVIKPTSAREFAKVVADIGHYWLLTNEPPPR